MWWIFRPGFLIPCIGKRRLPVNRDGSPFDAGPFDQECRGAPFIAEVWAFEWLTFGFPIWPLAKIKDARTGEPLK
ncbi:hypothetical protein [Celeribacter halophilus]|uniref:Uncharacterized protein n=1 Tax=Celeribacter halophilus TaxID=576117 RepID=A0A1I3XH04_9RHOB|nr:hypothetical protein [Celeribacter halophilus]SFK18336.1 hypothetical protein SAMN04488138_1531 [Celeribacter halophilus]